MTSTATLLLATVAMGVEGMREVEVIAEEVGANNGKVSVRDNHSKMRAWKFRSRLPR